MGAEDFVKLSVRARADFALNGVSDAAELAFYRGIQWSGLNNSHGIIPRTALKELGPRRVADELVRYGYWDVMPQGWCFTSWDKWQAEFEAVQEKRARDAERKRNERAAARAALEEAS